MRAVRRSSFQGVTRGVRRTARGCYVGRAGHPGVDCGVWHGNPGIALAVAATVVLAGCDTRPSDPAPGGPADPPAASVAPRAPLDGFPGYADLPQFSVSAVRGEGDYVHRPHAATVRVGVEDDGVDLTREVFDGRLDVSGGSAAFAYWRPDVGSDPAAAAPARIYVVDSRADDRGGAIRALIGSEAAARSGGAFVHDIAGGPAAWFEIPPLDIESSPDREGAEHGTAVAGVLARETARRDAGRNVAIVPMAASLDGARDVSSWLVRHLEGRPGSEIGDEARDSLLARHVSIGGTTSLSELHGRIDPEGTAGGAAAAFDAVWAGAVGAKLRSVDIVNISSGAVYPCAAIGSEFAAACRGEFLRLHRDARRALPRTAGAIAQADIPDDRKTIVVWAAGNLRGVLGDGARSEAMELVASFEEMRGHNIGVTALNGGKTGLADYAHLCGALPADWDAAADGEHYCLAAPGVHAVDYPYNPGQVTDRGTSFAAPAVSATLALMKDRFRGQLGNVELVKRLMATAADGLHEDDDPSHDGITSAAYGAGVLDPEAALSPVGVLATGMAGHTARVGATRLRTPAAYGDAAARVGHVEIAAFDAGDAPFWIPVGSLIEAGPVATDPIPRFEDDDAAAGTGCAALAAVAPRRDACLPFGRDGDARLLVGADGAGVRVPSSHGLSVTALTRARGRLDGEGRGAFAFEAGSSLLAVEAGRRLTLGRSGRWSLGGAASLALDLPQGLGSQSGSMFEAGPALISAWRLSLEHRGGGRRNRITVGQPARAEAGTGRLRFPSGRRVDGERTYRQVAFALRPTSRTVTTRWSHSRTAGRGEGVFSVFHSRNPGHARRPADLGAGVAWRLLW